MASPLGAQGEVAVNDGKGSSITVRIDETPGLRSEGLSYSTWGAAFVLSDLLHKLSFPVKANQDQKHFDILELGAGTGLVGLSAAVIWRQTVLLTDLPSLLPGLDANIRANKAVLEVREVSMFSGSLDWSTPTSLHIPATSQTISPINGNANKPSLILAADTFYDVEHPSMIANTISTWLAKGCDSKAILCYPLRFAYIDYIRDFWELMESNGLECTEEGRVKGRDEWNEVPGTEFEWCVWQWRNEY